MERSSLDNFLKELLQVQHYIEHIQHVNDIATIDMPDEEVFQQFRTHFFSFKNDKKTFEYKAIIISLYGLLEKHIELWVKEYLDGLALLIPYTQLSQKIQDAHFKLSMELIKIVMDGRLDKYKHHSKESLLEKLNECIKNPNHYYLNTEAFTVNSGNLTHKRIEEIFKNIDITITKELIRDKNLIQSIGVHGEGRAEQTEGDVLFAKINELVERRNSIAHGAETDDLLDLSEIRPHVEFLQQYCTAIFDILKEKNIQSQTVNKYVQVKLVDVFNKNIIAFSVENYTIKVNDWVIIKTPENRFYKKQIEGLQKDKKDYPELRIEQQIDIAVKIENQDDLPITRNCTFYIEKQ